MGLKRSTISQFDDVIFKMTCKMPSSRIVNRLSLLTFLLQPRDPRVRSVSEYPLGYEKPGHAWRPGVGVIGALSNKCPTSYVILHG